MYSGNHSPEHSLAALLAGSPPSLAREVFGSLHRAALNLPPLNLRCLPYQPLTGLAASLSAADLQVVVMGNAFVGLVHPCKIYNILSVGAPVLYIGTRPSHVTEILHAVERPTRLPFRWPTARSKLGFSTSGNFAASPPPRNAVNLAPRGRSFPKRPFFPGSSPN